MNRIEVNVITGEQKIVPLTLAEIAEIQSRPQLEFPDPFILVEEHIAKYFNTLKLLQMKTWWDEIPHQVTPKLSATYVWIENVTKFAITTENFDQTNLLNFQPPFTFVDISQEIREILYPVTITEEPSSTEVPELSTTITEEPSSTEVPELSTTITEEPSSTEVPELSS